MHDTYLGMTPDDFANLMKRYRHFQDCCNDLQKEPVKVFPPLTEKRVKELHLIREVSKDLQMKKEEDMKKAAQAAEEPKPAEEKAEEKAEEVAEEKKPEETEK